MCALLPTWLWLLLGLLPLEVQSRALTLKSLSHRYRLSLPRTSKPPKSSPHVTAMPPVSDHSLTTDNHVFPGDNRHFIWKALLHKEPPLTWSDPLLLDQSGDLLQEWPVHLRGSRGRRHAGGGIGRSHLMRVGCILGTCQVQNLSHRLYQLIGQSGREDSSPINPHSPHSYG